MLFWYVECLARSGDLHKARFFFEKALGYANHLGLYAEELGLRGEHLGNFPQAFTHIALISAAYDLNGACPLPAIRARDMSHHKHAWWVAAPPLQEKEIATEQRMSDQQRKEPVMHSFHR